MTVVDNDRGSPARKRSVVLALRYYGREMAHLRRFTVPGMLLPALGNTCIFYVAPLFVAQLAGRFAGHGQPGPDAALPYILGFAGVLLFGEILWRFGIHFLNRLECRGIEDLYIVGMDELLAKDAAFFHDNFAGSLTKRVLSFAARFEDFAHSRRWCSGTMTRCWSPGSSASSWSPAPPSHR
jgi:ATP-binding cassette subfamily B protein